MTCWFLVTPLDQVLSVMGEADDSAPAVRADSATWAEAARRLRLITYS